VCWLRAGRPARHLHLAHRARGLATGSGA
jgi:hypothetical protein